MFRQKSAAPKNVRIICAHAVPATNPHFFIFPGIKKTEKNLLAMPPKRKAESAPAPEAQANPIKKKKQTRKEREEERHSLDDSMCPQTLRDAIFEVTQPTLDSLADIGRGAASSKGTTTVKATCNKCQLLICTFEQYLHEKAGKTIERREMLTWSYPPRMMSTIELTVNGHRKITGLLCRPCLGAYSQAAKAAAKK